MSLYTKTKLGAGLTKTRNNKTGKTSYSESYRMSGGRTVSKNVGTGKVTRRHTRKP